MAIVDRNLLRIAVYEIVIWRETPPKAAVNEAVELAKTFGSESSSKFVNGVLGSVIESIDEK
jgi:N utilization substance protein B